MIRVYLPTYERSYQLLLYFVKLDWKKITGDRLNKEQNEITNWIFYFIIKFTNHFSKKTNATRSHARFVNFSKRMRANGPITELIVLQVIVGDARISNE